MKGARIELKIYAVIIFIIVISIIGYSAKASAQDKSLQTYLSPSYLPSYLGLSIFGNTLYPGLNGAFFSSQSISASPSRSC